MMPDRDVRYVYSGELQIAYEVIGDGPIDIVTAWDTGTNLDVLWDEPRFGYFLRRLGEVGRHINVDPRGSGLSDPMERVPTLEEWAEDVRNVLDAVGSQRAALIGQGNAAQLFMLFAAMYPNDTAALVTINGYARLRRAEDYPWGFPPDGEAGVYDLVREHWGTGRISGTMMNPRFADTPRARAMWARMERGSGTPARALRRQKFAFDIDVRDVLPIISAPTLVIQSESGAYIQSAHGQYLADAIPGAQLMLLPSSNHIPFGSIEEIDTLVEGLERFLTGTSGRPAASRSLMSVAFTDIVDSTKMASALGDKRWRGLLELHETVARDEVEAAGGRLVKFTGDGLLATFEGPARAVHCMKALNEALEPLGLPIRAGVHTGEVETIGEDVGGLAVHIAARISALAGAGEVLASSTVRDLVVGSGLEFDDRGEKELKGVPGVWRVLAVR